jgi:predicted O-methyltransferase YrrM
MMNTRTKYFDFASIAAQSQENNSRGASSAQLMQMYRIAEAKESPIILELGVCRGESTTVLLQACSQTGGRLVSVDIENCSSLSDSPSWQFVQSNSSDTTFIIDKAPHLKTGIDILYIDSLHTKEHVKNELTCWYPYIKEDGFIFFDDVDSRPYMSGQASDSFWAEITWNEIHDYIVAFYYANQEQTRLSISYGCTGQACLEKRCPKGTLPREARPLKRRRKTILNLVRYSPSSILPAINKRLRALR